MLTKTNAGGAENVWFYDIEVDGFSLDDKYAKITENNISDMLERFHNMNKKKSRERTKHTFFVSKEEIAKNDYELFINKYKKVEYVSVGYHPIQQILLELYELE